MLKYLQDSVFSEDSRLKRLKLTMIDNVSLRRNIQTFGKVKTGPNNDSNDIVQVISSAMWRL